jgi:hypothetical protein
MATGTVDSVAREDSNGQGAAAAAQAQQHMALRKAAAAEKSPAGHQVRGPARRQTCVAPAVLRVEERHACSVCSNSSATFFGGGLCMYLLASIHAQVYCTCELATLSTCCCFGACFTCQCTLWSSLCRNVAPPPPIVLQQQPTTRARSNLATSALCLYVRANPFRVLSHWGLCLYPANQWAARCVE